MSGSNSAAWVSRRVLERVAKFVSGLEDDDLHALVTGRARLTLEYRSRGGRPPHRELDVNELVERLQAQASREDVIRVLEDEGLRRAELAAMARQLKSRVEKQDSVARLRERIAEAAVGFRLRSDAIRGVDTSSKRGPEEARERDE